MAFTSCGTDYINGCLTSAAVAACGGFTDPDCLCATSGLSVIGQNMVKCLIPSCAPDQGVSVANSGYGFCSTYLSTHIPTSTSVQSTTSSLLSPSSTTSAPSATSTSLVITSSATLSLTSAPTSTTTASTPQVLSTGGKAGIGVGVCAFVILVTVLATFFLRRRRKRQNNSASIRDIQPAQSRLQDPSGEPNYSVNIPLTELNKDISPPYHLHSQPAEADSKLARAGHPTGKAAGTEATAFDFESQKVLLEPGLQLPRRGSAS